MDTLGLTHKDLAKALGVSETTIKSYRRKFPDCIVVASKGKPLRFAPEAEAVCRRIQALFAFGMAVEDVRGHLAEEFAWIERECTEVEVGADGVNVVKDGVPTEQKKALLDEAALLKEALRHTESQVVSPTISTISGDTHTMSTTISDEEKSAITVAREKISEPTQEKVGQDAPRTTPYTVLPPEVRTAISDMARTVVELTLQQKKLLKQVERLEARLDVALENMAHNQSSETSLDTKLVSPQSVCAKTPIHEQIAFDKNTPSDVRETQSVEPKVVEAEQAKTKNPLLKIFGLERHG